ncbi:hypothetical protein ACN38_g439 [Penicillium nordicum]|uniref:Uncharacterized protein n=1 Tax=Penicillium nordicum TaxID=229535 RepID=A0A0M8PIS0_9EURO|nr:hypothetical protein ACN38_g439 [Penicillium nordicum]
MEASRVILKLFRLHKSLKSSVSRRRSLSYHIVLTIHIANLIDSTTLSPHRPRPYKSDRTNRHPSSC